MYEFCARAADTEVLVEDTFGDLYGYLRQHDVPCASCRSVGIDLA